MPECRNSTFKLQDTGASPKRIFLLLAPFPAPALVARCFALPGRLPDEHDGHGAAGATEADCAIRSDPQLSLWMPRLALGT